VLGAFRHWLICIVVLASVLAAAPVHAGKRVALVIGNDRYATLPDLANAGRDATDMAAKLRDLGFEVILRRNASRLDIYRALGEFEQKLRDGDAGLMFYAGHGIEAGGQNWLIPADAPVEQEIDLEAFGVRVDEVLDRMGNSGVRVSILVLDACRDNPLPRRTRSARRGLAVVAAPADAQGTAILYAAAQGQAAQDGPPGGNGVFTGALLSVLDEPGLTLEQAFKQVNRLVQERTHGRQRPWSLVSLRDDFVLREAAPAPPEQAKPAGAEDALVWSAIQGSDRAADFELFLERYPSSPFALFAKSRLDELKGMVVASLPPAAAPVPEESTAPMSAAPSIIGMNANYVTVKTSNLRAEPTTASAKVDTLAVDTLVEVTGKLEDGSWLRLAHAGGPAWVWAPLIEPVSAAEHAAWRTAQAGDVVALEAFLQAHPDGRYTQRAKLRLATMQASNQPKSVTAREFPVVAKADSSTCDSTSISRSFQYVLSERAKCKEKCGKHDKGCFGYCDATHNGQVQDLTILYGEECFHAYSGDKWR